MSSTSLRANVPTVRPQIGHTIEDRIRAIQNRKQAIVSASMSKGGVGEQSDAQKSACPAFPLVLLDGQLTLAPPLQTSR
jgi:hypothetical protein